MWAIAHLKTDLGEDLYLSAHDGVTPEGPEPDDPTLGDTFGVKKFRKVEVSFDVPEGVQGEFQSVSFGLADREGKPLHRKKVAVSH